MKDPLEFHPVDLVCTRTSESDSGYSILNILDNVSAVDRKQSDLTMVPDTDVIFSVARLVIRATALGSRNIVRLEELPSLILVSAKLRERIVSAGLTGVRFMRIEDYANIDG